MRKIVLIAGAILLSAFLLVSRSEPCKGAACTVEMAQTKLVELQTIVACLATPTPVPTSTVTLIPTRAPTAVATVTAMPVTTNTAPVIASSVLFNADFESGNLSYFDKTRGEILGKGTNYKAYAVTSPAIGSGAAALQIGSGTSTAIYLFTYNSTVPTTNYGEYNVDFYIPGTIVPSTWWNVWQWKSVDNTYNKPIISLNILKINNVLQVVMFYTPGGININATQTITQTNPVPLPVDRWVNIVGRYYHSASDTGYVGIYQDGVKIFEKSGILTKPGNKNVLWSVNSYADRISPNPATIYVDNMRITQ